MNNYIKKIEKIKRYCENEIKKLEDSTDSFEKGLLHAYNIIIEKIKLMEE